jgi:two-component system sensor histidine kinase/response regulator
LTRTCVARVLIVDDEADLLSALCHILEARDYSIAAADSGAKALDMLRVAARDDATRFDVLITDLMMPLMDGLTLIREAQAIDRDLVSIVMTGHGTIDTAVQAMKGGALDYMLKPFNLNIALPVLSRALAVRKLRRENATLLDELSKRAAELEERNAQLQAANNDLDAYNSWVSHDIRGHLNRIIGFSQLLIDGKAGPLAEKQNEYLGYIGTGGQRILQLTDDLLRFARLGQQPVMKESVDVTTLVREAFAELQGTMHASAVELNVGALPAAFADPSLLRQVFTNLLSNALKFSRGAANPLVTVRGEVSTATCRYWVCDNGAGFDMAHADRLFGMFTRLQGSEQVEGSGIGLSIVRRIIERHGGRISAAATPGAGARFTFTLPAAAPAALGTAPS